MFHFKAISNFLGLLVVISGVAMLLALPFSFYFDAGDHFPILIAGGSAMAIGGLLWLFTREEKQAELKKRDGYLIVTAGWIIMSLVGALPYYLGQYFCGPEFPITTYTDAFFETMSGFTTTGASILGTQIESLPAGLHFWRSMTHWIGGMGIIVLTIAILPLLGIGGMQLYAAEVPGPTPDKLTPRVKETAKRLWIVYVALTAIQAILLLLSNLTTEMSSEQMSIFEAICHSMSTLSTGGFSTRQASMGAFAPAHQYVVIIFMFLAGINFALSYFLFKGKPRILWKNEEFRVYTSLVFALIVCCTAVVFWGTYMEGGKSLEAAFRDSAFQVLSVITTTGFGTADFTSWGPFLLVMFFILMFVGANAGSTSGGIKIVRHIVIFKNSYLELKRQIHPKAILPVRFNGKGIHPDIVSKIKAFFIIFILLFVSGVFIMAPQIPDLKPSKTLLTCQNSDSPECIALTVQYESANRAFKYESAMGSVAATLGNIGPGIGIVSPADSENFAQFSPFAKWFLSFLMLLGRLELFTVLMLLTPFFWKEK
ncbi:MAG: TrkH family potassium uptake protein [Bacteroidia bacterium]